MKTPNFTVRMLALVILSGQCANSAWAQKYPEKVIRFVVTTSAGGAADTIGRIVAGGLTTTLGTQVIVENRTGGGSNIGADVVAKSPADGYTLLLVNMSHAVNATLYRNLPYNLLRDFTPVTQLASSPQVLVVHPSLPVRSVAEFVKLAKARPGALTYVSSGSGTPSFLAGELFKLQAGVNLLHVPYRGGGEALIAVLGGEVPVYFAPLAASLPHIRKGTLRALGATTPRRLALLPNVPTVAESGYPGYECVNWYGIEVPAKTPQSSITILHDAAIRTLGMPDISKRMGDLGYLIVGSNQEQFAAYINSEIQKLARVITEAGLTPN